MVIDMSLDEDELAVLSCAPLWVVSAVLGRSGNFNEAEQSALWNSVVDTGQHARGLAREVLGSLAANRVAAQRRVAADPLPLATALTRVASLLELVEPVEADAVKRALLDVGSGVARARSLGRGMSDEDANTLLLVATLLGLVDADDDAPEGVQVDRIVEQFRPATIWTRLRHRMEEGRGWRMSTVRAG